MRWEIVSTLSARAPTAKLAGLCLMKIGGSVFARLDGMIPTFNESFTKLAAALKAAAEEKV
jgi:hypothetical protein